MLLLRTEKLPEGGEWPHELKFDGYRALAIKTSGNLKLQSRNDKDFNARYPAIVKALVPMPDDIVLDGEVVALGAEGGPSFNLLQNYGSAALVIGYYDGTKLLYAARTRNGFTPASRVQLYKRLKPLETRECPFRNLPEKKARRWGAGLTAAKMEECRWLKPSLVGQFEFVEWTEDAHLRHSRFLALRDDKKARDVRREG